MTGTQIDFWFTMGSTYSYLSVMRLAELERSTGISFRWRPFHLLIILQEMNHIPFADKPTKNPHTCGATLSDVRLCMVFRSNFRRPIRPSSR
jgi:2-hydroxychromene-2-carboxylate isomerase